ncbi:MAG: response regulator [Bacteroidota bacterium]|nr:MAG: response regulator [Bacteroidota bacterium]
MKNQPIIYLVDANEAYRKRTVNLLKSKHYHRIVEFSSGEDCYSTQMDAADIVITESNFGLESWSGLEFMLEYKRLFENTQFLFLTSESDLKKATLCIRSGARDYILKSKTGQHRIADLVSKIPIQLSEQSILPDSFSD